MADFEQSRKEIRKAREQRDATSETIATAREPLKRIAARQAELDRVFNAGDEQAIAKRQRLAAERERTQAELRRLEDARQAAVSAELGALKDWALFTDPRQGI